MQQLPYFLNMIKRAGVVSEYEAKKYDESMWSSFKVCFLRSYNLISYRNRADSLLIIGLNVWLLMTNCLANTVFQKEDLLVLYKNQFI